MAYSDNPVDNQLFKLFELKLLQQKDKKSKTSIQLKMKKRFLKMMKKKEKRGATVQPEPSQRNVTEESILESPLNLDQRFELPV